MTDRRMQAERRDGIRCAGSRLSKQAWIDSGDLLRRRTEIVLAVLSAVLGPYVAIMGAAGATAYALLARSSSPGG